jgi:PIN domain nuclease of toxin-antitoxin system
LILADSSAWIAFFQREPGFERLREPLNLGNAVVSDVILYELIPMLKARKGNEALVEIMMDIPSLPTTPDWEWIMESQTSRATRGKRLIGLADWLILDTARQSKVPLLTLDLALADAAMDVGVGLA